MFTSFFFWDPIMLTRSLFLGVVLMGATQSIAQTALELRLRSRVESETDSGVFQTQTREETWDPAKTAIIVCDAWDYHHCFNAVGRLNEFAPRLNEVLVEARERGVTIIHAPSDCMDAYRDHAARKRAMDAPKAEPLPHDIQSWCSVIPSEERGQYPIDQSDGGEDDDAQEHSEWAARLKAMGRNPAMPWKEQIGLITIDTDKDYISDQGDEVWNVLKARGIDNVILTGVHLNMCVLGRPFGLRQMARNGKHVVLMRDMTDTMYNPKSWPFVSHFEGTRRVIEHVEKYVCPTTTSDQIIGGKAFRFSGDDGDRASTPNQMDQWEMIWVGQTDGGGGSGFGFGGMPTWYRCILRVPRDWTAKPMTLAVNGPDTSVWCNGQKLQGKNNVFAFGDVYKDDANWLVVRSNRQFLTPPVFRSADQEYALMGRWQYRSGNDESFANVPVPAKFGGAADIVFSPPEPLWTPRPFTQRGQFTSGIEGPACDSDGNLYAVNFGEQGTVGRVRSNGIAQRFVRLPGDSIGNGIRFDPDGNFYVADYQQHNVLKVNTKTREITVHAHNADMNQPNDLAIAPDGTLYASDPDWKSGTGQLWRIDRDGTTTRLASNMGTTNGIEVSPDGKTLYVNESKQRNLWAFDITSERMLDNKRLLKQFPDHGFDGMRCDVDGNLYVTRYGKGVVAKLTPSGEVVREIPVLGTRPSNICFGGPDGCTAYVTEVDATRIVTFRVDRPGRSFGE